MVVAVGLLTATCHGKGGKMRDITTDTTNDAISGAPTVRKQIGKTTYVVKVHFNEASQETMQDKIMRMLSEEVKGK
jgi:hypothetical protein